MSYRILLIGSNGQVGWELQRSLAAVADLVIADRSQLDVSDVGQIRSLIQACSPRLVVNAAAYTAVDRAESDRDLADRVNHLAPTVMAEECRRRGAGLIHFSTDYVFPGTQAEARRETDTTDPVNWYGETKRRGEVAILGTGCSAVILRTSWVYATRGKNFLRTIIRLAREREELRIIRDQVGAPTWSRMLAEVVAAIVVRSIAPDGDISRLQDASGIYHVTAGGRTSWHGFAEAILTAVQDEARRCRAVIPIPSLEYPTPAQRPAFSVLDNAKLEAVFGLRLPTWERQLSLAVEGVSARELI